ncbi:MAG TPA: NADH-quinone oxidoreductase subunit J [Candidatus Solibacter sp.]|jgi:NADH:ubiquinone oxidoreductase subunit 6 (subunit J)|nr:NADH-quinone oxidoreductase subunit J [Candidatus Solibacter sp.]
MSNDLLFAITFYVLAALTLGAGLGVVILRNVVHAAVSLIACFFFVAWVYLVLSADLLWVAQLLIYAGAIPVLIVFAIMFTRRSMSDTSNADSGGIGLWAPLVGAAVFGLLLAVLLPATWFHGSWPNPPGTTALIGNELVSKYAVPFELVSVLLLAALIGAVILARREDES